MAVSCLREITKGGRNEGHTGLLARSNTTNALTLDSAGLLLSWVYSPPSDIILPALM